jgi:hypothetical protein
MVKRSSDPDVLSSDSDHGVVPFLTASVAHVHTRLPRRSVGHPATGPKTKVGRPAIHQVVVLDVAGRLGDVIQDLDEAVQQALADGPRGVVCDLSAMGGDAEPEAIEVLATAGRHVRDWPGIPVAVASPDPRVHKALGAHPLGRHLIVTRSMPTAVSAVLATPIPCVEWLRLAPHPTAPRASRNFVTRTWLDWGLGGLISSTCLVVSELVTSSTVHAGTDIDLSVAWNLGALRLTVRDKSPDLPHQRRSQSDVRGRGLRVVNGLSRAFGVLPAPDGGKVIWAVLNAAPPRPRREAKAC